MERWQDGQIEELLLEGRSIQQRLYSLKHKPSTESKLDRLFTNLMFQGKTKATIRLLTEGVGGDVMQLDEVSSDSRTVREILDSKHPPPQSCSVDSLLDSDLDPPVVHPVVYEAIDAIA